MNMMLTKLLSRAGFRQEVDFSCVLVAYKAKDGSWRGFVHPYDITIDGDSKDQVLNALNDLVEEYDETLNEYGRPSHLADKILSNDEDHDEYNKLVQHGLIKEGVYDTDNLHVETRKF